MKICLIGAFPRSIGDAAGGVANVMLYLAKGLAEQGHEIHVISIGSDDKTSLDWSGIMVHYIKATSFIAFGLANVTTLRYKIQNKITTINPDICHFHSGIYAWIGYKKPSVLTLHGIAEIDVLFKNKKFVASMKSFLISKIESYYRRRVKNMIVINRYLIDKVGNQIKGRVWNVANPVSKFFFEVKSEANNNIFYASIINRRKNILGLLKIFHLVYIAYPAAKLRIAGPVRDSKYMDECIEYIRNNNLHESVEFLGSLSPEEIAMELKNATCTVLVSYQETAPLIISESMAAGVPVVASNVGGVKYMIENNKSGFINSVDDYQTMAGCILVLLQDVKKRILMSRASRAFAIKENHIDSILKKTLSIYEEILKTET